MPLKYTVKTQVVANMLRFEWSIPHLYLDSKGNVTVGIGHLVSSKAALSQVAMYTVKNNVPVKLATLDEKKTDFDNIVAAQSKSGLNFKDLSANWYKKHTILRMKDEDIKAQLETHIENFYKELSRTYSKTNGYKKNFDDFPEKAQVALFDMIFNMGLPRFKRLFTNFNAAVKIEDWATAAKQSRRTAPGPERNAYVRKLFEQLANAKVPTPKVKPISVKPISIKAGMR